jgi:hypothetical protein
MRQIKKIWTQGTVAHACNPSTQETEVGELQICGQPEQPSETFLKILIKIWVGLLKFEKL